LLTAEWARGANILLLIKLAAVSDPDHDDLLEAGVDFIALPPVADSDSPDTFCASNLEASRRAGIGSQGQDGRYDPVSYRSVEPLEFTLGT
jgi:hypothetical protein